MTGTDDVLLVHGGTPLEGETERVLDSQSDD